MRNKTYNIEPRLTRKWFGIFGPALVVYDIKMTFEYWADRSYGNGGDFREATRTLCTMKSFSDATAIVNKLVNYKV